MDLDTEANSEFWTSLNLISTHPDEDSDFNDAFSSYLRKSPLPVATADAVTGSKILETKSLPITTIISRIQAEDSGSEDGLEQCSHPPPSHTGGKWKPTISQSHIPIDDCNSESKGTPTADESTGDPKAEDEPVVEEPKIEDLTCAICDRIFSKVENLVVHLTSQKHRSNITDDNRRLAAKLYTQYHAELVKRSAYQCACCTFAATQHDGLITHVKSQQHNENVSQLGGPLECVSCSFFDYDGSEMLQHCMSKEHHQKAMNGSVILRERRSQIKCLKCSKTLHSTLHYTRHMKNQHMKVISPDAKFKQCDYCDFQGKPSTVSQHITRTHRNERPYLCKICQTDYHSKYDLYKHHSTRKHIGNVFDSYKPSVTIMYDTSPVDSGEPICSRNVMRCHFCIFTTSNLRQLQGHYTSHHEDEHVDDNVQSKSSSKPVFCRYCNKQLSSDAEVFIHELNHIRKYLASQQADYNNMATCCICYADIDADTLEYHQLQHNPYNKKRSAPAEEGKSSKLSKESRGDVYHLCTVSGCHKSYRYKGDLRIHLATHTGDKSFVCDECDKSFATKKQLKAHSRTHSSITPFSCDYCKYKCKTRCHLQRHMRIHAGSKPYSCLYCEYSSTTIGNLRKHMLQSNKHRGLPMYECTQKGCKYVADKASLISEHLTNTHKLSCNKLMMKSTENDWTEILEGHSIISAQH